MQPFLVIDMYSDLAPYLPFIGETLSSIFSFYTVKGLIMMLRLPSLSINEMAQNYK
jgi:hypothetical protein